MPFQVFFLVPRASRLAQKLGLHRLRSRTVYLMITLFFIILGTTSTVYGAYRLSFPGSVAGSNLASQSGGAGFGWGPPNISEVSMRYLGMAFTPRINDSDVGYLWIMINADINTSRTFTFAFMSTFQLQKCTSVQKGWSTSSQGDGSVIYFDYGAPANKSKSGTEVNTAIGCLFTGLPNAHDYGKYTIVIPFGSVPPNDIVQAVQARTPYFQRVNNQRIDFMLYIPLHDAITASFPQFWADNHAFEPHSQRLSQEVRYFLNETSDLTISYEDSQAVTDYSNSQSYGLFYLALGLPTLISSASEFVKTWKRIEAQ